MQAGQHSCRTKLRAQQACITVCLPQRPLAHGMTAAVMAEDLDDEDRRPMQRRRVDPDASDMLSEEGDEVLHPVTQRLHLACKCGSQVAGAPLAVAACWSAHTGLL